MNIFANRILNLKNIKLIGFDMDHTLIRYKNETFEKKAFDEVLKKLVNIKNYPSRIFDFKFDYNKMIRGLVFDKVKGNVLKVNCYGEVKMALHGLNFLSFDSMKKTYKGLHIDVSQTQYFSSLDTVFSVSMGLLFSLLVDLKDDVKFDGFPEDIDYIDIFNDIQEMLDLSHSDNSLKGDVKENLKKYIVKDENLVKMLHNLKKEGKILAVITNSDYNYTKLLLDYAINSFEKYDLKWTDIFDYVITLSSKPSFFTESNKFLKVDHQTALMSNWNKPLEKGIYQGGCATELQKQLELKGDQILYLGDHIYGDIVTLTKSCDWKTGLIIEELSKEIDALKKSKKTQKNIDKLMSIKESIEIQIESSNDEKRKELFKEIRKLDADISENILKYHSFFNPYWGPIMRAGQEESRLAYQIQRYSCIYMSKITNLIDYSPRHYFRPKRRPLPHE